MTQINWTSAENEILINPRMNVEEQQKVRELINQFLQIQAHVWVSTSGSTQVKWVALSKKAILASARSVNSHLNSTKNDVWLNPLPFFHVGGMGIDARGYLSGARLVHLEKWDVEAFCHLLQKEQVTLTALVPTQVYDLVMHQKRSPNNLRAIIVGGGRLSASLFHQANKLGWRLLPSYGMTECCSQIATANLYEIADEIPPMHILPHLDVKIDTEGYICIRGDSLLTGYALNNDGKGLFIDPKQDGWFKTEDIGYIDGKHLHVVGRNSNFVKIGGESVDINRLESVFETLKLQLRVFQDAVIVAVPEERLGHVIHLATTSTTADLQSLIEHYNKNVLPFERIRSIHIIENIPRTPLNKLLRQELLINLSITF